MIRYNERDDDRFDKQGNTRQFTPAVLTVSAGTGVTWLNKDDTPHLVVSTQNKFKQSGVLDEDQRFTVTLTEPGTYDYFCSIHPKMQGQIVVR